jgi:hypothetical protein
MKKSMLIPMVLIPTLCLHIDTSWEYKPIDAFEVHKENVLTKMIQIESEWNPKAVGDSGTAIGLLQIRPIMIREVNRLLKEERYSLEDRWDSLKSIEIFHTFQDIVNPDWDEELAARRWNGGIRGEKKMKTNVYWNKYKEL